LPRRRARDENQFARAVYEARFEQSVSGLTEGASVLFNGVRAGAVIKIALDPDNPKRVTATLSVDPQAPVRADTQVDVTYLGLTGVAAVALVGGTREAPRLTSQNGQPPLLIASPSAGRSLTEAAQVALRNIDELVSQNSKGITTAVNGIATFNNLSISAAGSYTLVATTSGLAPLANGTAVTSPIDSTSSAPAPITAIPTSAMAVCIPASRSADHSLFLRASGSLSRTVLQDAAHCRGQGGSITSLLPVLALPLRSIPS
jgi:hypothetical protein